MECLTPAMIGSMRLKNRFIFPSMCNFYCDAEGFVTEQLKADNQMEWVARMNSIHARVEEILREEIIYC